MVTYFCTRIRLPANNIIHVAIINGKVKTGNPNGVSNVIMPACITTVSKTPSTILIYLGILVLNATPKLDVDPQTYEVFVDGKKITSEPATELPLTQRYFLF